MWIIKNAFHEDKILADYRPLHIMITIDKEKGRKEIKTLLRHSIDLKTYLKRDMNIFEDFLARNSENLSDALVASFRISNAFIFRMLFDSSYKPTSKPLVKNLDLAIEHLKKNLKT